MAGRAARRDKMRCYGMLEDNGAIRNPVPLYIRHCNGRDTALTLPSNVPEMRTGSLKERLYGILGAGTRGETYNNDVPARTAPIVGLLDMLEPWTRSRWFDELDCFALQRSMPETLSKCQARAACYRYQIPLT